MWCEGLLKSVLIILGAAIVGALTLYVCGSLTILPYSCVVVGTDVPRIRRAYNYVPASMRVSDTSLSHTFCCRLVCFCDEVQDGRVEACAAMVERAEALSVSGCRASPGNASVCPPTGAAAVCNNGPFCCRSCNQSACSSSTDLTATPAVPCPCPCARSCRSACGCCKRVEGRLCRLFCDPCDKVRMMLHFQDRHGQPQSVKISRNYSLDAPDAQHFYDAHRISNASSILAFYKPSDASLVYFWRGYGGGRWAYFLLLGAFPVAIAAIGLAWLLLRVLLPTYWACVASWALWVGIVLPLCVLLPILQLGYPTPYERRALIAFIPLVSCLGLLPLIPAWCLRPH